MCLRNWSMIFIIFFNSLDFLLLFLLSLCLFWKSLATHTCSDSSPAACVVSGEPRPGLGKWGYQTRWDSGDILECPHFLVTRSPLLLSKCRVQNVPRPQSPPDLLAGTALKGIYVLSSKFSSPVFRNHTDKNFWLKLWADKRGALTGEIGKELEVMEQAIWGLSPPPLLACVPDPHSDTQASSQEEPGQAQSRWELQSVAGQPANLERLGDRPAASQLQDHLWNSLSLFCDYKVIFTYKNSLAPYEMNITRYIIIPLR